MKRLTILAMLFSILLSISYAHASEHSALSNVFSLDTRGASQTVGLEHSALSNIFTLDTRDVIPITGLEHSALSNAFTLDTRDLRVDVDGNGVIEIPDLVLVAEAFGTSGEGLPADINGDGIVNILDLIAVAVRLAGAARSSE